MYNYNILDDNEINKLTDYNNSKEDFENEIHEIIISNNKTKNKILKLQIRYNTNFIILIFLISICLIYLFILRR